MNGDDHIIAIVQERLCNVSCSKREDGMKKWISKLDNRLWALVELAVMQIGGLALLLIKVAFAK